MQEGVGDGQVAIEVAIPVNAIPVGERVNVWFQVGFGICLHVARERGSQFMEFVLGKCLLAVKIQLEICF